VVVALSLDGEGFIRKHRVFEGKMADCKSLIKILDQLRDDFKGIKMPTIIFDRGVSMILIIDGGICHAI
jgi:hypothetical protein